MGARAINPRWFRTPKPEPEPFDYHQPLILRPENRARFLAHLKQAGFIRGTPQPDPRELVDRILAVPLEPWQQIMLDHLPSIWASYEEWSGRYLGLSRTPVRLSIHTP